MSRFGHGMSRRRFLEMGLMTTAAAAWPGSLLAQPAAGRKRNVLVLLTDDQTFDTIHMLGNATIQTPNLDQFAAQGTTLSHCFNQGAWHGAICVASRAMMNSGRNVFRIVEPRNDRRAESLQVDTPLWGEHFRNHGYTTFATGKWHNGGQSFVRSFSQGDAVFLGGMHPYGGTNRNNGGPIVTGHAKPALQHYDGSTGEFAAYDAGETWSTDAFADAAVSFLDTQRDAEDPFFAYVSFTAPHDPRHAPKEFLDLYDPEKIELPPNFMPEHPFDIGIRNLRDEVLLPYPRDPDAVRREIAIYYAMISHIDARVGDILGKLRAIGQLDNTFIVFTSDHGLAVGQHGLLGKQNQYDPSVRVPMIWRGPGIAPGEISHELSYIHQMYGTTCELAGLPLPEHLDVPSLGPVIRGEKPGFDSIYGAYMDRQRMLRTDRYKLIRYPKAGETQLFDLKEDPWEMNDLAEVADYRDRVRSLDEKLRAWQQRVGDGLQLAPLS